MKTKLLACLFLWMCASCAKITDCCVPLPEEYLPLQVGNYWKVNEDDYVEVTGKADLPSGNFFVLSSYIKEVPSPAFARQTFYLRMNGQKLEQGYANSQTIAVIADFGLVAGQSTQALEQMTVVSKTYDRMRFRYNCLVCSFSPSTHEATYINGVGFAERNFFIALNFGLIKPFKEARINGVVIKM
jgi:hypothetical protein